MGTPIEINFPMHKFKYDQELKTLVESRTNDDRFADQTADLFLFKRSSADGIFMRNDYTPTVVSVIDNRHEETWPYSQRAIGMFWNLYQGSTASIKRNFERMGLLGDIELRTAVCRHIKGEHLISRINYWLNTFVTDGSITNQERDEIKTQAENGIGHYIEDPLNVLPEFRPQTGGYRKKRYL